MNTPPFSTSNDFEVLSLSRSGASSFSSCTFRLRRETLRRSLCEFAERGVASVVVMAVVVVVVVGKVLLPTSPADLMASLGF